MNPHIDIVATRLLEARKGGPAIPTDFVEAHPLSVHDGVAVQGRVQAALGAEGTVGAWKISPVSALENPRYAPIFAQNIYKSPARFAGGTFRRMAIECEIAYRLGRDLLNPPYNREQVADAIESLVPLIEVCDSRLVDHKAATHRLAFWMADDGVNGAVVIGPDIKDWRAIDVDHLPVTMTFKGATVAKLSGPPKPDRLSVVVLLANQIGTHCGGLHAGQIVTTGNICGNVKIMPGTEVVASYPGIAELRVMFEN